MVICKFYQQGNCRYGSKCTYEHLDLKQVIKADVEGAINGKQWPFTCYGPFRDKPCIPNFVEDQSFEEMRMLCYDAKQKNYFEQFHQQFNRQAMEATNKMRALLQLTPDIIKIVGDLYDNKSPTSNSNAMPNTNATVKSNPFGFSSNTAQTNSIFKSTPNTNNQSIFGTSNLNPTQNMAGNIFTSSFGSMSTEQSTNSIFAQPTVPKSNSIFGGSQTTSLFSQPNVGMQTQNTTSNLFAQTVNNQPQSQSLGLFGQSAQSTQNIFSQGANSTNLQQQQQQLQLQQQQQHQQQQLQQQQQQQQLQQQQQTKSIFGQNVQQSGNLFNLGASGGQTNMFSSNTPSLFSNQFTQNTQQSQPQPQPPAGLFQNDMQQMVTQTSEAMQTAPQPQQSAMQHSFQQTQQVTGQLQQPQQNNVNATLSIIPAAQLYTPVETLTAEELEAFKANTFTSAKLPTKPPPKEFC
ncbi:putative uncharacterized protein DDB_G0271606 [Teleopsis dalmanni]|uniref:putative uncharacterized protein DDB_G0271606 n=1 Tax=Teleopsis dalmanni TaxID=139649 RepID=UPI0018CFE5F0|nr:putative uncharacterized protein DDB_G0271606 [Teleopsis dalmanni]